MRSFTQPPLLSTGMQASAGVRRTAVWLLVGAACVSALPLRDGPSVFAPSAAQSLQRRAIMKGDNYVPLGNTTVPLSPLLLVFGGLGAAAVALVVALIRILVPSCMSRSSRIVLEERERARQDLRIRGAVSPRGSPGGSPVPGASTPVHPQQRRYPPNKPMRKVGRNSRGSFTPADSASSVSRKRSYRGTSISLSEASKKVDRSVASSLSGFQVPLLNSNDSSSGSSSFHLNAKETMSERAKYPITATNDLNVARNNPRLSFGTRHLARTSSIGKGADLYRTRSGGRQQPEIALHPQPVDPAYAQRWARRESYQHPLQTSRRDSTLSAYEVSSSSAEHSYLESTATSRIGSFSNMSGNPLQPLSAPGFGAMPQATQPWASPRSMSRSPTPDSLSPNASRLAVVGAPQVGSRNSSVSALLDSDGSDAGVAPQTAVLIPSRATSFTK